MLGKLLKYEFKATGRMLGLLYLVVLAVAAVTGVLERFNDVIWEQNGIALAIFMAIYVLLILAMGIITFLIIIERFYRNLLQGEGYLMHTLPVPTWMHVVSKMLSALIWEVLAVAVLLISLFIFIAAGGGWHDIIDMFGANFLEFLTRNRKLEVVFIIGCLIQLTRFALMFYASMVIGASANRHKIFFSILAFVVIVIVINVISMVTNMGVVTNFIVTVQDLSYKVSPALDFSLTKLFGIQILMDAIYSVVFFVITNFFLKRKLNLE